MIKKRSFKLLTESTFNNVLNIIGDEFESKLSPGQDGYTDDFSNRVKSKIEANQVCEDCGKMLESTDGSPVCECAIEESMDFDDNNGGDLGTISTSQMRIVPEPSVKNLGESVDLSKYNIKDKMKSVDTNIKNVRDELLRSLGIPKSAKIHVVQDTWYDFSKGKVRFSQINQESIIVEFKGVKDDEFVEVLESILEGKYKVPVYDIRGLKYNDISDLYDGVLDWIASRPENVRCYVSERPSGLNIRFYKNKKGAF